VAVGIFHAMSQFLMQLVAPVGLAFVGLIFCALRLLLGFKWRSALIPAALAALLYATGATPLAAWLQARLERPYAGVKADDLPAADAIVMLGGLLSPSTNDVFGVQFSFTVDRAVAAAELVRQGKAENLVLGGRGWENGPPGVVESDLLLPWLRAWKLTPKKVFQLRGCLNTHDEAVATRELADEHGWKRIILVTSAAHMRRAEGVFRRAGLDVICFAADFSGMSALEIYGEWHVLPSAGALNGFDNWLHEEVGWYVYRWRGWIE